MITTSELTATVKSLKRDLKESNRAVEYFTKRIENPLPFQMFRLNQVAKILNVTPRTVQRWLQLGGFPQPHKIGPNTTAWRADELDEWIASKKKPVSSGSVVNSAKGD